ncbi:hypothetical protein SAMN04487950_0819 [Halogranum rubrum]|uniref:DUF8070 domain-containing protein n=2 Tax=Halogranum rubrum TaxID=553466 RepID=A0A1I4BWP6_9EURY|nr:MULTISPECIES: hypothetical protein [Halogranum]EJN58640.1 hypothetical protein HSB1_31180 [Halogranum salarium B-1]SFK73204.1 hypothetical protein SAMN04487950_0819 [Halogranum rubrum]
MDFETLRPYLLWYTGVGGVVTAAVLYGLATLVDVDVGLVATVLFLGSLVVVSMLLTVSDQGIESAAHGAEVGFGSSNPMDFQPDSLPVPNRLGVVCYFVGLTVVGGATVAFLLA